MRENAEKSLTTKTDNWHNNCMNILQKLGNFWENISKRGIYAPFIHDARTGKPSITLFFAYTTFTIAIISTIALHFNIGLTVATFTSILFWVISVIFYRLRNLDKAKIDLDDRSIELNGSGDNDDD